MMRETTQTRKIVKISPYDYADRDSMPDYVVKGIEEHYAEEREKERKKFCLFDIFALFNC